MYVVNSFMSIFLSIIWSGDLKARKTYLTEIHSMIRHVSQVYDAAYDV